MSFSEAARDGVNQVASTLGELAWEEITSFEVESESGTVTEGNIVFQTKILVWHKVRTYYGGRI